MPQLIHPELSYAVRGAMIDVYNALGPMLREEFYENAIAIALAKRGIRCQTQKEFIVCYEGAQVGQYYVDVWIEDGKILFELKVCPAIETIHQAQAISYLKVTNADLAIVANFGSASFEDQRLPNRLRDKRPEFNWQAASFASDWLYPKLTDALLCVCHRVHFVLGSGFLHQVYRRAMRIELARSGLAYEYIKQISIEYENELLGYQDARLILVENKILLATFALREMDESLAQLLKARMRRLGIKLGMLANFHGTRLVTMPVRIE
ncbi:MAG: GxxExxY protein [Chloroflexi bacterium]|nr:GxxExxY protein [Chloroflexota bacterium]